MSVSNGNNQEEKELEIAALKAYSVYKVQKSAPNMVRPHGFRKFFKAFKKGYLYAKERQIIKNSVF